MVKASPLGLGLARGGSARPRPILLAVAGDSAAGKTTLARGIEGVLGPDRVTRICVDDYHKYDRRTRAELGITPLDPGCNYVDIMEQHLQRLSLGQPILKPVYSHSDGTFQPPEYVAPEEFVVVEGLLPLHTRGLRDCLDVKVYLDPEEELRREWKIQRDCAKRGYAPQQVTEEMDRREPDSARFIRPQRAHADIVVRFHRQHETGADSHLGARVVLRPTLPHPELQDLVASLRRDGYEPIRLFLDRDHGKPAEILEIRGDCPPDVGADVEEVIWHRMSPDHTLRRERIGRYVDASGEERRSESLALAQLLIVYHLVGAARAAGDS